MDDEEQYYLLVGTEVSAKYRGAFCEAKIKSVKISVFFRISIKKDGKVYSVAEDAIKGTKKVGSTVEVQLPETAGWHEGVVLGAKDKSTYTVEFDDGDVRTLSRGSLCLQGVRHFAEGDTLDQLPLTDPENFGAPVLNWKRKAKRKVTQTSSLEVEDVESDDLKALETEMKRKSHLKPEISKEEKESVDEKRRKWLSDPLMGKLVLVEPSDKRKHWYPAVCVNPFSIEECDEVERDQIVVRSFKNGKLLIVNRCERLTRSNAPSKVEVQWKDVLESAFSWQENATVPDVWKSELSEDEDEEKEHKGMDDEDDEKSREFLEQLYKFMEDRGTPITKAPVLGYKDLDLYLLYNLVVEKEGFFAINNSSDWKEIYTDLGIPKITPAAGHHAKMAYSKYLLCFEEYVMSFQQNKSQRESITKSPSKKSGRMLSGARSPRSLDDSDSSGRRLSRRRKVSESMSIAEDNDLPSPIKESKRSRKSKLASESKRDSDADEVSSTASSEKMSTKARPSSATPETKLELKHPGRTRSNSGSAGLRKPTYKIGDKLKVKYGLDSFRLYHAKVMDLKVDANNEVHYLVHYAGWNSRHDEWIKSWKISGILPETSSLAKTVARRPKTPTSSDEKKDEEKISSSSQQSLSSITTDSNPSTPTSLPKEKEEIVPDLAKPFQAESKPILEKRRIRRRSTSSSTPPPHPPSVKRASSVEKFLPEKTESKPSPKQDSESADVKIAEETSPPSGVPTGLFPTARRTSGRRSKSPAYLKDTALYGLTKRRRHNSALGDAQINVESDPATPDADDMSSESSSKSSNSSTSDVNTSSPLTLWSAEAEKKSPEKSKKSERKRMRRKSGDKKLSQISEESGRSLLKRSAAYDIFDEDVPSIELERSSGDSGRKTRVSSRKRKASSDSKQEVEISPEEMSKEPNPADTNPSPVSEQAKSPSNTNKTCETPPQSKSPTDQDFDKTNEQLPENNEPSPPCSEVSEQLDANQLNVGGDSAGGESPSNQSNADNEVTSNEQKHDPGNEKESEVIERMKQADSESDNEETKNKQKKRKKPKKKKKRAAPPKAPVPLKNEDLASMCPDDRIQTMMDRMEELRRLYQVLKQEVSWIDRKRKRAKRREQEAAEQSAKKSSMQSPNKQNNDANNES